LVKIDFRVSFKHSPSLHPTRNLHPPLKHSTKALLKKIFFEKTPREEGLNAKPNLND